MLEVELRFEIGLFGFIYIQIEINNQLLQYFGTVFVKSIDQLTLCWNTTKITPIEKLNGLQNTERLVI